MRAILLVVPEGRIRTAFPVAMRPEAISPANPRKLASGRLTSWTGSRNGRAAAAALSSSTRSRWSSNAGPPYHGMASDLVATLSPLTPEVGMAVTHSIPIDAAKAR